MKRRNIALGLLFAAASCGWLVNTMAQRNAPFDVQETRKELEILEGILSTTLRYAEEDSRSSRVRVMIGLNRSEGIESFYLYGQGAIFIIPSSFSQRRSRLSELERTERLIDQVEEKATATDRYLRMLEQRLRENPLGFPDFDFLDDDIIMFEPPEPPEPPAPPAVAPSPGPGPRQGGNRVAREDLLESLAVLASRQGRPVSGEELKEWIQTNRATLRDLKEKVEKEETERAQREGSIQDELISALARHGDSLSVIKPNEYISLIFVQGSGGLEGLIGGRNRRGALVISVQMSQLAEYKRGSVTLDQLRERLVRYQM